MCHPTTIFVSPRFSAPCDRTLGLIHAVICPARNNFFCCTEILFPILLLYSFLLPPMLFPCPAGGGAVEYRSLWWNFRGGSLTVVSFLPISLCARALSSFFLSYSPSFSLNNCPLWGLNKRVNIIMRLGSSPGRAVCII